MVLPLVEEWRDILQPQPHQDQREQLTHLSLSQGWLVIPNSPFFDNQIARGTGPQGYVGSGPRYVTYRVTDTFLVSALNLGNECSLPK